MEEDLNLDSEKYSVILIVFFIGYVLFEVPSNMVLSHIRPSYWLPALMFCWGGVTVGMAFSPDYHTLVGLRILMGSLEAGFAPGMLMLLSSWYKKEEQSKRFAVYISAAILSGAFGGLLAGSITSGLDSVHGQAGWRWLFVVEGAATMGVALIAVGILPDFPSTASKFKFTEEERRLAVARLVHDQSRAEEGSNLTHMQALKRSLSNWKTWLFVVGYMVSLTGFHCSKHS